MKPVLVTGGAGFIGSNIAAALASRGQDVIIFDSLSRKGVDRNVDWLKHRHGNRISVHLGSVSNAPHVYSLVEDCSAVIHLAAQTAVTTSVEDPTGDFDTNARGTLNVLEAVRQVNPEAPILFASTNKVYGALEDIVTLRNETRKRYEPAGWARSGIDERQQLDFHSPYGCSKGVADQYVRDNARIYGLKTAVLRMSCIYGTRQFGTEDQGWVAHFFLRAMHEEPITIFGDGYQVRDILFVDDCVNAWLGVFDNIDRLKGRIFNLGGGEQNALSLHNLLAHIKRLRGKEPRVNYADWRPGDQPWYVSDTTSLQKAIGWQSKTSTADGLLKLQNWLIELAELQPAA